MVCSSSSCDRPSSLSLGSTLWTGETFTHTRASHSTRTPSRTASSGGSNRQPSASGSSPPAVRRASTALEDLHLEFLAGRRLLRLPDPVRVVAGDVGHHRGSPKRRP